MRHPEARTAGGSSANLNLCLLFSRCGLSPETRRGPRTGPQVQANSISLSCTVEIGQTRCKSAVRQLEWWTVGAPNRSAGTLPAVVGGAFALQSATTRTKTRRNKELQNRRRSSREAAERESPARKCRVSRKK